MIQRIQSIWLLLAAACAFFTIKYSFYSGNKPGADAATGAATTSYVHLNAGSNWILLMLTIAVLCISVIDIFLYKNRKLQLRLVWVAILISVLDLYLYYRQTTEFTEGNYNLTSLFSIAVPVFLVLAAAGIRRDEKLVRSTEKLR